MKFSIPTLDHGRHNGVTRLRVVLLLTVMIASVQGTVDAQQGGAPVEALLGGRSVPVENLVERRATPTNLQTFTGALGNIAASQITNSGNPQRPFEVDGEPFNDFSSAASRSCSIQHNACADLANSNKNAGFTVGQCDSQQDACNAAASTATQTAFQTLFSTDANFDYFCDV